MNRSINRSMNGCDLRPLIGKALPDYASVGSPYRTSYSDQLVGVLTNLANANPYVILSRCQGIAPSANLMQGNRALLSDIKGMGLRAFELMAAHTGHGPARSNPSLIVENSFLIFRNSQHSMRTFIKSFIALAEVHQIDKFVPGLPDSFDYVNSPIEVDGLSPGAHYLLSTRSGPQVIDAQFSDKVFADYRKAALLDFGVRPEQWQWLWASVPQNYISAMGMNALGLRWNTVGCF